MPAQVFLTLKSLLFALTILQSDLFIGKHGKCEHSLCSNLIFFQKLGRSFNKLSNGLKEYCWYLVTFALAAVGMDLKHHIQYEMRK